MGCLALTRLDCLAKVFAGDAAASAAAAVGSSLPVGIREQDLLWSLCYKNISV